MTRSRPLLVASVSGALAIAAAAVYLRVRPEAPVRSVDIVDQTEEWGRLLDERVRAEPEPEAADDAHAWPPPLVREKLDEKTAGRIFPALGSPLHRYDPVCYFTNIAHWEKQRTIPDWPEELDLRTNSLGMREDEEPLEQKPDVRILVTGDSHVDGVCSNRDSLVNVLERSLAKSRPGRVVEALNAACGGYNPYNYLGVLEKYRELEPDVFIAVVYGGNDFSGMMVVQRYFHRRSRPRFQPYSQQAVIEGAEETKGIVPQELSQVCYFLNNPSDVEHAFDALAGNSLEMQRVCAKSGTELVLVYLPPPLRGQPERVDGTQALTALGLPPESAELSDRIADSWLAFLAERGIASLDLRPVFRAAPERYYWDFDHHINLAGHRAVAAALRPVVDGLLDEP